MAKTILIACLSLLLVGAVITSPDAAFQASLQGLTIWWNIVFPGLMPFLVLMELMSAFGLVHAISVLLQPAMSRLFKLPGEAAYSIIMGWMGGYPAGAEAVSGLLRRNAVTNQQGQRLLALAHMPNPLFMLVVVGAGFLHQPIVGLFIAAAVWLSAIWVMLLTAVISPSSPKAAELDSGLQHVNPPLSLLHRAAIAMRKGRDEDGRSFGQALGEAVASGVSKLMIIGGLMMFAAVLAKLSEPLLLPLLSISGLSFIGIALFEGHLGAYAAAAWDFPGPSVLMNAASIAAVLSWSGLSGIMQAGHAIAGTNLKLGPFVAYRAAHALHAFVFLLLLWKPLITLLRPLIAPDGLPAFAPIEWFRTIAIIRAENIPLLWPASIAISMLLALLGAIIAFILIPRRRTS